MCNRLAAQNICTDGTRKLVYREMFAYVFFIARLNYLYKKKVLFNLNRNDIVHRERKI